MDHLDAIKIRAAERYVLNQLDPVEAEQFEEHFFSCPECAEEVRWINMFEANAKRVVGRKVRETAAEFVALANLSANSESEVVLSDYARQLVLSIPLPEEGWKAKHVSLATGAGTARFTMKVPEEQVASGRVAVVLSVREMDPGRHILTLVSDQGDYIEFPFGVKLI